MRKTALITLALLFSSFANADVTYTAKCTVEDRAGTPYNIYEDASTPEEAVRLLLEKAGNLGDLNSINCYEDYTVSKTN